MLKNEIAILETKIKEEVEAAEEQWKLTMQERENDLEFMRNNLEQDMKEQIDIIQSLEEGMQKMEMDYQNEMKIKLNEKELEVKEENKRKLKERLDKVRDNLQFEMSLKEKNHKSQMERKIDEVATLEESLLRAVARKNEVGKVPNTS